MPPTAKKQQPHIGIREVLVLERHVIGLGSWLSFHLNLGRKIRDGLLRRKLIWRERRRSFCLYHRQVNYSVVADLKWAFLGIFDGVSNAIDSDPVNFFNVRR